MFIAFVKDDGEYGVLLGAYLSRHAAVQQLTVSGDLLFNDDGSIDQGSDWPFGAYARQQQKAGLNVSKYRFQTKKG